ncbi:MULTISPECIES: virB8 family protein [Xanthomonas]|uniref:Type IV secretion system protein n=1 Tax=Xanthomonas rydalmerensis TaxID=3046274 RepID=A0ABZ0JRC3_9XANT|nr:MULTISPECIES: type IV secretion system protein [unclassified Xanthomonas]MBB5875788.1 type IV secretion system protein VirB8 [Xanthomonas sp. 3498]WOS42371.1 type IV secretion system protein [Xanthomonas sp. DM-2023]WOS46557.1 type IV secretion system protein [Xanthomonas sp. DM-2023]WOS50737.1 type IV secretion system protein [Xanthomonas sp. DM-2023]WOS54917.1 type IV secretion system protein [Xanthomonas sp. DM-2023]
MFGKKPVESENVNKAVAKAVNYEISIADLARRSERRAWWVAFGAIIMCLLLGGGYYYMLPLKEKVPYLVMADAYTGNSTISVLRNSGDVQSVTSSEALARSNVARFITARESYDSEMMGLNDWNTVFSMAPRNTAVGAEYFNLHAPNNPSAPYYTYGKARSIRVKILSISLLGGSGKPYTGANVRFQRSIYDKKTGQSTLLDNKFAIMGFRYNSNLAMEDELRVQNPLGFQVTDYRVDNDYSAMPVPPSSAVQTPAAGAVQQPAAAQQMPGAAGQVPVQQMPGQPMAPGAGGTMPVPQQEPMANPTSAPVYPGAQPATAPPAPNVAPQHNGNGANVR